ncbi:hypothetical protein [Parasphingorhabdus sp.]|uniref:hypothetical protein n=1 Tax=Parasphingorhabdus sp. TaxID=2709688 RepID=UPI00329A14A4
MTTGNWIVFGATLLGSLSCLSYSEAADNRLETTGHQQVITPSRPVSGGWVEGDQDPGNQLVQIEERRGVRKGLIPFSPIQPIRDRFTAVTDAIYEAANLRLGMSFHSVGQYTTNNIQNTPRHGGATDFDFVGTWELFNRGKPTQGEIFFGVEGRWDYGPIGPQNLGFVSVGTSGGSANSFSSYKPPAFILRNLY